MRKSGKTVRPYKPREAKAEFQRAWMPKKGEKCVPRVKGFGHIAFQYQGWEGPYQPFWVCTKATKEYIDAGEFHFEACNFSFHKVLRIVRKKLTGS